MTKQEMDEKAEDLYLQAVKIRADSDMKRLTMIQERTARYVDVYNMAIAANDHVTAAAVLASMDFIAGDLSKFDSSLQVLEPRQWTTPGNRTR